MNNFGKSRLPGRNAFLLMLCALLSLPTCADSRDYLQDVEPDADLDSENDTVEDIAVDVEEVSPDQVSDSDMEPVEDPPSDVNDLCAIANGGCDSDAVCTIVEGEASCECPPGYLGGGQVCDDVASAMDGLRLELPCGDVRLLDSCDTSLARASVQISGDIGAPYDVTIRVRGVVEQKSYYDSEVYEPPWSEGGTPEVDAFFIYSLDISVPDQTYYLNAGVSGQRRCWAIDYTQTVRVGGLTEVVLEVSIGQEGSTKILMNRDGDGLPIRVEGVDPYPEAFDGQFIQINVISVDEI